MDYSIISGDIDNNHSTERRRFEEFYKSGSDKSDPYKNSSPPPYELWKKRVFETLKAFKLLLDKGLKGEGE